MGTCLSVSKDPNLAAAQAARTTSDDSELEDSSFEVPERAPEDKLEQFYELHERIGRGHYAVVYEGSPLKSCRHLSGSSSISRVACKRIDKKGSKLDRLAAEVFILRKIRHRNIVSLVDVFEDANRLDIVMELVLGGELFEMLVAHGAYDERDAMQRAKEIMSALAYLHQHGIVHRDLKPENVLLTSKDPTTAIVKIADFGLSKLNDRLSLMKTVCGTWAYCAPEVKKKTGYGPKVDVWSAGVIIYILLVAYHPFDPQGTSTDDEMWDKIKVCDYDFSDDAWNYVSEGARDLLRKMICLSENERLSASKCLTHTWLGGIGLSKTKEMPATPLSPGLVDNMSIFVANSKKQAWQAKTPRPTLQTIESESPDKAVVFDDPTRLASDATTPDGPARIARESSMRLPDSSDDSDDASAADDDDGAASAATPTSPPTLTLQIV